MKLCMGCMNQMEEHLTRCPYCGFDETTLHQESYYLAPGTIIGGRYIVGRVISYGGYTVSYLGMDAAVNRKVMVKEYLPSDFSTRSEGETEITIYSGDAREQFEQGLTNFLNEANRIQHLSEPEGIAQIYDCIAENDTGYVISEYIEGNTLRKILDGGKRYSVEEARQFISKILVGLSKVHPLDIVHCDISPDSIVVSNDGTIKLLDFGATRYMTTANSKSLAIILKQGYAPEEQYRSQGIRGPWTDVYALGAVMYRMITGIIPQESVERTLVDELKEPSRLGIEIPENIENALMNALNVYQQDRTPSAEIFLQELNSPMVKRIKVKKRKNETGKFPFWAKGLVACLFGLVIVGSILLHQMSGQENAVSVKSTSEKMIDLGGQTYEEVQDYAKKLNRNHPGWNIQVEKIEDAETVFDSDEKKDGTVALQYVPIDTDLASEQIEKLAETKNDFRIKEQDNVEGTIRCKYYSSEIIHYGEIGSEKNAFAIAKRLGIDTSDSSKQFHAQPGSGKHYYFELSSIVDSNNKVIDPDTLKAEKKAKVPLKVKEITINYYASDFFYWKKGEPGQPNVLGNYVGKNIKELPKFTLYKKVNETEREKTHHKRKLSESNLVDQSYYTFQERYETGEIFRQDVSGGEKLDGSKRGEPFLHVIKEKLMYRGKTGDAVKQDVKRELGLSDSQINIEGDAGQEVDSVKVVGRDGNPIDIFRKEDLSKIVITTKAKAVQDTNSQPTIQEKTNGTKKEQKHNPSPEKGQESGF